MNETLELFKEFKSETMNTEVAAVLVLADVIRTKEFISKDVVKYFLEELEKLEEK